MKHRRVTVGVAASILTVAWLLAYGPTISGGFIKDDFAWLFHSRIEGWSSIYSVFTRADGFYRPLVHLSFGITEAVFGTNALPYAITNLGLAIACAAAVYALATALGLQTWAALLAAATWAFNFHGINMAVVWLSGRTSLLATLFATLSALSFTRKRWATAGMWCFAALLAKEEVLALPIILTMWMKIEKMPWRSTLPSWVALIAYLVLRQLSGAWVISDAPPFYQFTIDPAHVWKNIVEYADRSMTFGVLVMLLAMVSLASTPDVRGDDRRLLGKGLGWLVCGFALTLWLPVRSSLYVAFPSVGFAIVTAAIVASAARHAEPARVTRVAAAGLLLPFMLLPIYWARNVRWTELRALTNDTIQTIRAESLPSDTLAVLEDDPTTRANFRNAFGTLFPEAAALFFDNRLSLWIDPPQTELVSAGIEAPDAKRIARFRLVNGRVEAVRPASASLASSY